MHLRIAIRNITVIPMLIVHNLKWMRESYFSIDYGNIDSVFVFLDKKIKTSFVKLILLKAKAVTKYTDICISELKFY